MENANSAEMGVDICVCKDAWPSIGAEAFAFTSLLALN